VVTAVLEQWPSLQINAAVFEHVLKDADVQVLGLLLEKFSEMPMSTRILVAAASLMYPEIFRAKQQSITPNDEVLEAAISRLEFIGPHPQFLHLLVS